MIRCYYRKFIKVIPYLSQSEMEKCRGVMKNKEALRRANLLFYMVPGAGIEPARPCDREILSLLCLPISPPGRVITAEFVADVFYHCLGIFLRG